MSDPTEFDRFYLATAPKVLAHLYLITGNMSEAQDCTQEAYSRAWQRWDALTSNGQNEPVAWVRSVGCRLAISNWRRRMAQARAWRRHGPQPDTAEPSADVVAVRQALATLAAGQRAVIAGTVQAATARHRPTPAPVRHPRHRRASPHLR